MRSRLAATLVTLAAVLVAAAPASAGGRSLELEFRGQAIVPTGTMFEGTTVGGLSSITYDSRRHVFYTVSDDQGQFQPARHRRLIFTSEGLPNTLIDPVVLVSDNNFAPTQFTQFLLFALDD